MSMGQHPSSIVGNVGDVRLMFVDDFIPHWISADGVTYEIGERVPVVRIGEALCFNEVIGLASCDTCDFVAVAPMTALWRIIYAHQVFSLNLIIHHLLNFHFGFLPKIF